ncbi:hypothetical protein D8S78_23610 [Natrialba swarupiae]|nr:hypothetical protein [Natrialba swarupiae]
MLVRDVTVVSRRLRLCIPRYCASHRSVSSANAAARSVSSATWLILALAAAARVLGVLDRRGHGIDGFLEFLRGHDAIDET